MEAQASNPDLFIFFIKRGFDIFLKKYWKVTLPRSCPITSSVLPCEGCLRGEAVLSHGERGPRKREFAMKKKSANLGVSDSSPACKPGVPRTSFRRSSRPRCDRCDVPREAQLRTYLG